MFKWCLWYLVLFIIPFQGFGMNAKEARDIANKTFKVHEDKCITKYIDNLNAYITSSAKQGEFKVCINDFTCGVDSNIKDTVFKYFQAKGFYMTWEKSDFICADWSKPHE